jgi:hypothetical protein
MKKARAPSPQLGNNLWTGAPPVEAKVLARFAGSGLAVPRAAPSTEGTLGAAERSPRRGGGREAALEVSRPAQAGHEAAVGSRQGAQASDRARERPEAPASPAGASASP